MPEHKYSMTLPTTNSGADIQWSMQAILDAVDQVNGERAPRAIPEHDPHYLSIGKVAKASVENRGEDVLLTTTIDDTHSTRHFQHEPTGATMIEMTFTNDARPFVRDHFKDEPSTIEVTADRVNFRNWTEFEQFETQAKDPISHADHTGSFVRQSLTPEPLIKFLIDYPELAVALVWVLRRGEKFLRYTVDETLRKVGDDISDALSRRIRNVIKVYDKQRADDNRHVTSQLIIRAEITP